VTPPLAVIFEQLPPLEEVPGSFLDPEKRLRSWMHDVRDYVRYPFLLRQAIEWREEVIAKPGPKTDEDGIRQLQAALVRLRKLAELIGGLPPHKPWGPGVEQEPAAA
jgi:hypothetical protein